MQSLEDYLRQPELARFPFLFIVTYGRSGSTLLQGLLNALPGYHIRGENNAALVPLFRTQRRLRHTRSEWGNEATTPGSPWYGAELIEPDMFVAGCADAFFRSVLRPSIGARCCGFKEIRYDRRTLSDGDFVPYLRFLRRAFPGAAFVFNFRNVEDTLKSGWWPDYEPGDAERAISIMRTRMGDYARDHAEHSFSFDYDAVCRDHSYFAELCAFLGEEYDPEMVERVMSTSHSIGGSQ
ncbi:sulfotransferase [Afifella marina]|uniref:Sulfotransferase family protein n=1 Tax=Afifella marina DSM 2698 TaxID=1120955 RepID=A0A1G5NB24_AFIMA|nr:sulfotransferase [Afifella marina]SCZ34572.1 Sulfotransferase family protein [Afifella marina DSM 2698]